MNRILLCCILILICATVSPQSTRNVLLITIDTIRPDSLSSYGGTNKTPNLDRIAQNGILFENTFSTVPLTFPSHASILTGVYPGRHGIHHNGLQIFRNSNLTIQHLLKQNGYKTVAVVSSYVLDRKFGLAEKFDVYDDQLQKSVRGLNAERTADQTYKAAIEALTGLNSEKWFAWIHFFDPHIPYSPPKPLDGYAGEVKFVDEQIGRLLQWLKSKQMDKNLILCVVGDHGESLGEHGEATHGFFVYNSTLKVPMLLSYPGSKQTKASSPVSIVDIVPSLLQLAGIRDSLKRDGRSLIGTDASSRDLYFESFYPQLHGWNSLQGLVRNEWKFISTTRKELYNLKLDPAEQSNVSTKQADVSELLQKGLQPYIRAIHVQPSQAVDAETREKLESLGYVGGTTRSIPSNADPKDKIKIWSLYQDFLMMKNAGRHASALLLLEKIAKEESANSFFQLKLAMEYRMAGKVNPAVQLLEKIIRLDPQQADVYHELALAYQTAGNDPESLKAIQAAIAISADRSEFHDTAGIVLAHMGKVQESIAAFRKGLALDPNNAILWHNFGNVLRSAGRFDEAASAFGKALERDPQYASAWNGLGAIRFQQGKLEEATSCLLKANQLDPDLHEVYFNLGVAYQAAGNVKQARSYYTAFLKRAPETMRAMRNAAEQRLSEL